jgi:hypothetical protein
MAERKPLVVVDGQIQQLQSSDNIAAFNAGAFAIDYAFDTTTTDSDPGAGNLRLDNATQSSATTIRVDYDDAHGESWTAAIQGMADPRAEIKGYIRLVDKADPTKWILFQLTGDEAGGGYHNLAVEVVRFSDTNPFSNGDGITLSFTPAGESSVNGAVRQPFTVRSAVSGPPHGDGQIRCAASTFDINDEDADGESAVALINLLTSSTSRPSAIVRITDVDDNSNWRLIQIDGLALVTGDDYQYYYTSLGSGGSLATGARVVVDVQPIGNAGQGALSLRYQFSDSTTDADPGSGSLRFNNGTIASATAAYVDNEDESATDVSAVLDTFDDSDSTVKGHVRVQHEADPSIWAVFECGTVTDSTGYRTIALTYVAGAGSLTDEDPVVLSFTRTGDKGDDGADGADGSDAAITPGSVDNALVRADGTSNDAIQGSTAIVSDSGDLTLDIPAADGEEARTALQVIDHNDDVTFEIKVADAGVLSMFLGSSQGANITTAERIMALGATAGRDLTTADDCVFIGANAGQGVTEGAGSIFVGTRCGRDVTTAVGNIGFGIDTLRSCTGNNNIGFGSFTLFDCQSSGNIGLGRQAGRGITTGGGNVFIGDLCGRVLDGQPATASNTIVIGADNQASASNQVVLGNSSITSTILRGDVETDGGLGLHGVTPPAQSSHIADATATHSTASFGDVNTALDDIASKLNDALAVLEAHGLTATS